jgi:thymidylate kinase
VSRRTPAGRFVVIVGPDGVGKTTIARQVLTAHRGPTAYFHFRPPVQRPMDPLPPEWSAPPPSKGSKDGSVILGWVRLARNFAWFWIAYLTRVLPATHRGALVIGDRWAYGYFAQPYALKYYGPPWLARVALRTMPQPDVVVNLTAPSHVIHDRKPELAPEEIKSELSVWLHTPARNLRTIDASAATDVVAAEVTTAIFA